jgi:hypothetical protein
MTTELLPLLSRWTGGFGRPLTDNCVSMHDTVDLRGLRLIYSGAWRIKRIKPEHLLDDFLNSPTGSQTGAIS